MRLSFALPVLSVLIVLSAWVPARAEAPVALVLDVTGPAGEAAPPFSELYPGDALELADGTLLFMHYPACEEVLVEGGRLSFSQRNYSVQKGKVADVARARCPEEAVLGGDTQVGGVVLRSAAPKRLAISPRPLLVLAGRRADLVSALVLKDGERVIARYAAAPGANPWPTDAPDLAVEARYTLEIVLEDATRLEHPVRVEKARPGEPLRIVRID